MYICMDYLMLCVSCVYNTFHNSDWQSINEPQRRLCKNSSTQITRVLHTNSPSLVGFSKSFSRRQKKQRAFFTDAQKKNATHHPSNARVHSKNTINIHFAAPVENDENETGKCCLVCVLSFSVCVHR